MSSAPVPIKVQDQMALGTDESTTSLTPLQPVISSHSLRNAPLAQLAEQVTLNHWVVGSIPTRCITPKAEDVTKQKNRRKTAWIFAVMVFYWRFGECWSAESGIRQRNRSRTYAVSRRFHQGSGGFTTMTSMGSVPVQLAGLRVADLFFRTSGSPGRS